MACSVITGLTLYPAVIGNFRRSVFQDTRILAQKNLFTVILGLLGCFLSLGLTWLLDWLRRKKQPIFGKSNITYGPPQWKPVYPLFSKQFWHMVLGKKKQLAAVLCITLLIVFVISVATSLGLPPRKCLLDDGSIQVYNCLDQNTATYHPSDVARVRIYTCVFSRRGFDDWGTEIEITMHNDEQFHFSYRDFQRLDNDIHGSITGMHQIKSCFDPGIVILEGTDNIDRVIRSMDLNQREINLLYSLFDMD